ncbi:MAG: DNRLRE domain-containing protein, partial [Oscillospiraceae bacterium]|nr:DNRLRE domain-containing protein [Oscillospiraceae bacterium]
ASIGSISAYDILSATFYVREAGWTAGVPVNLHLMTSNWSESSITWNSHSSSYYSYVEASASPSNGNYAGYDITNIVRDWLTADLAEYGFMLVSTNETSVDKTFCSSEHGTADNRPYVVVNYDNSVPYLNYHSLDLDIGATALLTVQGTTRTVSWSSTDPTIASVSSSGVVTGHKVATAVILVYVYDYGTLACSVVVTIPDGVYYIGGRVSHHIIIEDKDYQYFVDIEDFDTEGLGEYANIELMPFDGGESQKWQITHLGSGVYTISCVNTSTAYYLGVASSDGYVGSDAVLRTGQISDNVKWKIATTSSGAYKLISFPGASGTTGAGADLVLAADSDSANLPFGRNLCRKAYTDNTVYSDEWTLLPVGNDACLLGILDSGHDHSSVFGNIGDELLALGYKDFNINCTDSISRFTIQDAMENCRIFISRSHGQNESDNTYIVLDNANDIRLNAWHIYNFSTNTAVLDLSNCDLALFGACYTGATPGRSLPDAAVAAGADYAIGLKTEVGCVLESKWVEYFIQNLATRNVPVAAEAASDRFPALDHETFCYIVSQ